MKYLIIKLPCSEDSDILEIEVSDDISKEEVRDNISDFLTVDDYKSLGLDLNGGDTISIISRDELVALSATINNKL